MKTKLARLLLFLFYFICFICFISLSSCGFQRRGDVPLSTPLHTMYLQMSDPYGQLGRDLKKYLKASGVHLTASPQSAVTVLDILKEDTSQQLLSVGGTQLTRQYNLILTVTFQITDSTGTLLVSPQEIKEVRTIPIQSNQVLAGSNEANNLYTQMRQAIVYDIMNRLSSQEVTHILMNPKP